MSRVFGLGDTHFGHKSILKYRTEFKTVQEHDDFIINNINKTIGKRDTFILFGDIAFDKTGIETLKRIKFCNKKILILGNHCAQHMNKEETKEYFSLFDEVIGSKKWKGAWLTHIPIHESELRNSYCIHGHTHNAIVDDTRYVSVCCEKVNYTPADLQKVMVELKQLNKEYEEKRIEFQNKKWKQEV